MKEGRITLKEELRKFSDFIVGSQKSFVESRAPLELIILNQGLESQKWLWTMQRLGIGKENKKVILLQEILAVFI